MHLKAILSGDEILIYNKFEYNIMNLIEDACNKIVSPPKFKYSVFDLGPMLMEKGRRYDFQIRNRKNELLQCSLYQPNQNNDHLLQRFTVVYLHSMNGSRLECLTYVQQILSMGLSFCSFDFSGCGNSEGNHISFGSNERFDVEILLQQLIDKYKKEKFILWGRSMGAVACVKFAQMINERYSPIDISAMILDSPFKSFKQLIIQIGAKKSELPQFLVHAGYFFIKKTLEEKGQFQIEDLEIVNSVKNIYDVPTLFLVSREDTTISPNHSEELYAEYSGIDKKLVFINGMHNESRDEAYLHQIKTYIDSVIKEKKKITYNLKRKQKYRRLAVEQIEIRHSQRSKSQEVSQNCSCSIFQRNEVKSPVNLVRRN